MVPSGAHAPCSLRLMSVTAGKAGRQVWARLGRSVNIERGPDRRLHATEPTPPPPAPLLVARLRGGQHLLRLTSFTFFLQISTVSSVDGAGEPGSK